MDDTKSLSPYKLWACGLASAALGASQCAALFYIQSDSHIKNFNFSLLILGTEQYRLPHFFNRDKTTQPATQPSLPCPIPPAPVVI